MAKESILVVEDEEDIRELILFNLIKDGYKAYGVATGEKAVESVRTRLPDLVVLDLMLPEIDGLEVCKTIKNDPLTKCVPVVMLTAKGEEADVVTGLELGADDYIVKPFSPRVLVARIKAVLRRKGAEAAGMQETLKIHDIVLHPGRHEVLVKGKPVDLTHTEFKTLHFLAVRPGWVFTRYQIVDAVHGSDYPVSDRSVDVQIVGLRKKLGPAGKYVQTVRGVGYRFKE